MARKIIFLDFGGVLDSVSAMTGPRFSVKDGMYPFDPRCIELLDEIVEETKALIVICASARMLNSVDKMKEWLVASGFKHVTYVLGALDPAESRNQQAIEAWLANNPDVTDYVILDDFKHGYSSELLEHMPRLISSQTGLAGLLPSSIYQILRHQA